MASEPVFKSTGGRRSERHIWSADVQFRCGTRRANVQLRDISPHGARIQGVFLVRQGDRLFIKLPAMESIEARVAWVSDFEFGCEFIQPLNPLVLEARIGTRF